MSRLRGGWKDVSGQSYSEPAASTLTALRQARADRLTTGRQWARPIRLATAAAVPATVWWSAPHPGLSGTSLGITLAACGFVAAMFTAIWLAIPLSLVPARRRTTPTYVPVLTLLVASSAVLELQQPSGPAPVGLYLSIIIVARVLGPGHSAALFTACFAFIAGLGLAGITGWDGLAGPGGLFALVAVFVIGLFVRRIQAQTEREEQLLAKLEESQKAELRAASLVERQRLAREMHDVLAHSLSGLVVQLEGTRLLAATAPGDARLPGAIDHTHKLARSGLGEARQAISMLRGDEPPDLRRLADAYTADISVPCLFTEVGAPRDLTPAARLALYRVTQEALTNVRRHARPDKVDIWLAYLPKAVTLTIQDFGAAETSRRGEPAGGYGLTGMRERAGLLGGSLEASYTHDGFRVLLTVPA
jgi:signal transduction histidine kinase